MSRYIDADALKEKYGEWYIGTVKGIVDDAPTIDAVEVVHGEWIVNYIDGIKQTECSECGTSFITYDVYGWNYCPWCGAKMDGEREGE